MAGAGRSNAEVRWVGGKIKNCLLPSRRPLITIYQFQREHVFMQGEITAFHGFAKRNTRCTESYTGLGSDAKN